MNKILHKINDAYCFAHITFMKLIAHEKSRLYKDLLMKILSPKDADIILKLFATHDNEDVYKCPMTVWTKKKILDSFKHGFYLGMFYEDKLISVIRIYMHHWYTVELSGYIHPDFRNKTFGWVLFFYTAEFVKKLHIKNIRMTAMEETSAISRIIRYNIVKEIPSPEGKVIMEIDVEKLCGHSYNPLRKK